MNSAKLAVIGSIAAAVVLAAGSTANINGNTFGSPKAPVLLEVFSDFQCPGCKAFHDNDFPRIMNDYVTPGKMYVIYRYFPLTTAHPHARACAEFACASARVGRYQKVAEALFANQAPIFSSGNVQQVVDAVLTPTEAKTVNSLTKSPEIQHEIDTDMAEGNAIPVRSTPTLYVTAHGHSEAITWGNPMNYSLFRQYIDALVGK